MTALVAVLSGSILGWRDLKNDGWLGALKWGALSGGTMFFAQRLVEWDEDRKQNALESAISWIAGAIRQAGKIVPVGSEYVRTTTLLGTLFGMIKGLVVEREENRALTVVKEALAFGAPRFLDAFVADGILKASEWT
jgi:hypothetical protein